MNRASYLKSLKLLGGDRAISFKKFLQTGQRNEKARVIMINSIDTFGAIRTFYVALMRRNQAN